MCNEEISPLLHAKVGSCYEHEQRMRRYYAPAVPNHPIVKKMTVHLKSGETTTISRREYKQLRKMQKARCRKENANK